MDARHSAMSKIKSEKCVLWWKETEIKNQINKNIYQLMVNAMEK